MLGQERYLRQEKAHRGFVGTNIRILYFLLREKIILKFPDMKHQARPIRKYWLPQAVVVKYSIKKKNACVTYMNITLWFGFLVYFPMEMNCFLNYSASLFVFFFFSEHVSQPIPHFYHLRTGFVWLLGIAFQLVSMQPCCSLRRRTEMKTKAGIICCIVLQILTQYLKTRDFLTGHIKYSCNPHVFFSSAD